MVEAVGWRGEGRGKGGKRGKVGKVKGGMGEGGERGEGRAGKVRGKRWFVEKDTI